jgi:hypothetical protein
MTPHPEPPVWCVRANVVQEREFGPLGFERRSGTKHFRGGAKVWVIDAFFGVAETVIVVGHHRGGGRLVKMALHVRVLTDFKAALVYSPGVTNLLVEHHAPLHAPIDELTARERAAAFQRWKEQSSRTPWNKRYRVVSMDDQTLRLEFLDQEPALPVVDIPARLVPRDLCVIGAVLEFTRSDDGVVTLVRGTDTSR